jgi:hypothetical protein
MKMAVEDSLGLTNTLLASYEKTCKDCGKVFIIQTGELYTYKIHRGGTTDYYCCYTHWLKHMRLLESKKEQSQDAYLERLRANKNKYNQRRREKIHGYTQNARHTS